MYRLIIEDDEGRQSVVHVSRSRITIGRREGNTIRLNERNVSRVHARLFEEQDSIFLEDAGARYGVRVNGRRIDGRILVREGDDLQIGDYHLSVLQGEGAVLLQRGARQDAGPLLQERGLQPLPGSQRPGPRPTPFPPEALGRLIPLEAGGGDAELLILAPRCTLGRTTEADLTIVHPSIRRLHAVFVRESGRDMIVAGEGVDALRVDGQAVRQAVLEDGVRVEIGSVAFRYAAPSALHLPPSSLALSDDATATREVLLPPARPGSGPRWAVFAAAVAAAVGIGALLFLLFPEPPDPAPGPISAQEPHRYASLEDASVPSTPPVNVPPALDAGEPGGTPDPRSPADTPDATPGADEGGGGMVAAREAMARRAWEDALRALDGVLARGGSPEELEPLFVRARGEQQTERQLGRARSLAESGDGQAALQALRAVPETSVYHLEAVRLTADLLPSVLSSFNDRGRGLLQEGRLPEALEQYQAARALGRDAWNSLDARSRRAVDPVAQRSLKSQLRRARKGEGMVLKAMQDAQGGASPAPAAPRTPRGPRRPAGAPRPAPAAPPAASPGPSSAAPVQSPPAAAPAAATASPRAEAVELFKRGRRLQARGRTEEAELLMRQALRLVPGFADPHLSLGLIYERRGQRERALDEYRQFLIIAPNDSRRAKVEAMMRRLRGE